MRKLLTGEPESYNRQGNEAEQVNDNKNVRGMRGSTARSLSSQNMPKQWQSKNLLSPFLSENYSSFLASQFAFYFRRTYPF